MLKKGIPMLKFNWPMLSDCGAHTSLAHAMLLITSPKNAQPCPRIYHSSYYYLCTATSVEYVATTSYVDHPRLRSCFALSRFGSVDQIFWSFLLTIGVESSVRHFFAS